MKKLALLVFLSVSVQASEIEDLIQASASIKQTFDKGIMTVGGQIEYANVGGIAPTGMAEDAFVSYSQAEAYNSALSNVSSANYSMSAQQYFDQQVDQSYTQLDEAINSYVEAAQELVKVVQVNDMANNANQADDTQALTELKTYVENNDLELTSESVDGYNESLKAVEISAQTTAVFVAISSDQALMSSAQEQSDALGQSFYFAEETYYSQGNFDIALSNGTVSLDVSGYLKTALDVLAYGQDSMFYQTSPTGSECFFSTEGCE